MLEQTPVLILCGGLGSRLRPVLADLPKGLAAIGDRPFLQIQIELLHRQGARHFVLCVGHLAEHIRATFGDGTALGVRIGYSEERDQLLGTAGAIRHAGRFVSPRALVLNGDTYLDIDYAELTRRHVEQAVPAGAVATVALARAPDGARFGTALLDQTGTRLVGFREKDLDPGKGDRWLNAGAYVVEQELIAHIPAGRPVSIEREVFPGVIDQGGILAASRHEAAFHDIGTPEAWVAFATLYQNQTGKRRAG